MRAGTEGGSGMALLRYAEVSTGPGGDDMALMNSCIEVRGAAERHGYVERERESDVC